MADSSRAIFHGDMDGRGNSPDSATKIKRGDKIGQIRTENHDEKGV